MNYVSCGTLTKARLEMGAMSFLFQASRPVALEGTPVQ